MNSTRFARLFAAQNSVRIGASAFAMGTALIALAAPAAAQNMDDGEVTAGERAGQPDEARQGEIVVTARRREEALNDVPIAITAYGGEALAQAGALDVTDIAQTTPNTTLEASRGTNSTLTAFIRGVGQQDPVSGFEQGVGIYLDDVYLNRPQAAVLDIYDVERIEVLRGPQGTLYGRNTIGGAVKYVTRPLPLEPSAKVKVNVGTYEQIDLIASVSFPVTDDIRVGGSFARLSRGGFGENLTTGQDNYNKDVIAGRLSVEAGGFGAPYTIKLQGDYTRDLSNPRGGYSLIPDLSLPVAQQQPLLDDVFDTQGALIDPRQKVTGGGVQLNASLDLTDTLTVRSITAYRKDDSASPIDFDTRPAVAFDVPAFYFNDQTSQEFQLLFDNGAISALAGFYYLDASADTIFDVRLGTLIPGLGFTANTTAEVDTETYAVFGDVTFDVSDMISVSLGGRYTWDERTASILRQNYILGGSPNFDNPGLVSGAPSTDFNGSSEFKKFTPRASVTFKPSVDHTLYASYSQGFKGGGFDPRGVGTEAPAAIPGSPTDAEVADYLSFAPEKVDSYEVGYKGFLGDDFYIAVAGFYADYTDVQIPGSVACTSGGVTTFCGIVSNAGKATFKGIELETNATLARDIGASGSKLTFAGSAGYIDAQYDEYITNIGNTPTDVADFREVQNTPEFTASGTLGYSLPVGGGDLNLTSTLSYRSKTYQFEIPNPFLDQDGYALLDANIMWTSADETWRVGLHGRNLLDKEYKTSGYTYVAVDAETGAIATNPVTGQPIPNLNPEGILTTFYGNPRQVFLSVTFQY